MDEIIKDFLDHVCIHINCKGIHKEIRDELAQHIEDLKEEYIQQGYDEIQAAEKAVAQMGSSEEIGISLNRQHKPQMEWRLIFFLLPIVFIGSIIMYTSSQFERGISFTDYVFTVFISLLVFTGIYFFDYTRLKKTALPIFSITMTLLVYTLFCGNAVNGAIRYLPLGSASISTDIAIFLLPVSFAGFLAKYQGQGIKGLLKLLLLGCLSIFPLLALPSILMALILIACYSVLLVMAVVKQHFGGSRKIQAVLLAILLFLCLIPFGMAIMPYARRHLAFFLSKDQWIPTMADYWLSASNWFGKTNAAYQSARIEEMLPSLSTNYVLINIIATLGWAVGILLILLILAFIARMFITTFKIKNRFGFYLSLAACVILSMEYITGVFMNLNMLPPASATLPFLSYGGTSYVANTALVALLVSIWRRNNLLPSEEGQKELTGQAHALPLPPDPWPPA